MKIKTGRDPFARLTVRKRLVVGVCSWCGRTKGRGGWYTPARATYPFTTTGRVWQYYVDADNPCESRVIGRACSIECLRALKG